MNQTHTVPVYQRVYWIGMDRYEQLFAVTDMGIVTTDRKWSHDLKDIYMWPVAGLTQEELASEIKHGNLEFIGNYKELA